MHTGYFGKPLDGTFSSDGLPYFRTRDIARVMELKDLSHFSEKLGKCYIKDIVYKKLKLEHPSVLNTRVLSRVATAYFLDNAKKIDCSSFAKVLLDWNEVEVNYPENWTLSTKISDAIPCFVMPPNDHTGITFKNFIEDYGSKILEFYGKLSNVHDRNCMDILYPSLNTLELEQPPKTFHVTFEDKMFTYTLSK